MKAGIPTLTAIHPLMPPRIAPNRMAPRTAAAGGHPANFISHAEATAHKPATEPTDKSISPAIMRNVCPTAMSPMKAKARRIARSLSGPKKEGDTQVKKPAQRIKGSKIPISGTDQSFLSRAIMS